MSGKKYSPTKGNDGIYYLHVDGDLIYKPQNYVDMNPDFADSDFVKRVWPLDLENRGHCWIICIEALVFGANRDRVFELAQKWHCTDEDAEIFASKADMKIFMDGDAFCATFADFINLQESQAGFGPTPLDAFSELAKGGLLDGD